MVYEIGQIVILCLVGGDELVGEWSGNEGGWIQLQRVAHTITMTRQTVEGVIPNKVLLSVSESGNISDAVTVREDKVVYIKTIKHLSELYKLYRQTVTDIEFPKPGPLVHLKS